MMQSVEKEENLAEESTESNQEILASVDEQ